MINHINKKNNPQIVNISQKQITERVAKAEATISFDKITFNKIKQMKTKKGSLNSTAILAGIMGAKETSRLIPLCHNIPIDSVNVDITKNTKMNLLKVSATVQTSSKTGVEMEALTAVAVSCLTIYDMCKYLNKSIKIVSEKTCLILYHIFNEKVVQNGAKREPKGSQN